MRMMNFPKDMKPNTKMMVKSMLLGFVGMLLTAHVLVYATNIWRPSVWGTGVDQEWFMYGFMSGFFTWLGFYVPMGLSSIAWEGRSWKLYGLNMAHSFIQLQIMAMTVSYMFTH